MRVQTADTLREDDRVLTHGGTWQTIKRVMTRDYSGEVIAIKPQGGFETVLTPEHPVLCVKNTHEGQFNPRADGTPQWTPASEVRIRDSVLEAIDTQVTPVDVLDMAETLRAERSETTGKRSHAGMYLSRLIVGPDAIRFSNPRSHPIKRFVPVSGDLCRLIGYYLAEGSLGKHNVTWNFHANETEYHQDVTRLLDELFGTRPSIATTGNSTILSVSSLILHDFFAQFGRGAAHKFLPTWVLHLPTELQIEVINGMWRGDGSVQKQNGILNYVSASRELVVGLRMMLYRLGIVPGIQIGRPNGVEGHVIAGKPVKRSGPLYQLRVSGEYSSLLARLLGMPEPRPNVANGYVTDRIVDGFVHRRVKRVEVREYSGTVYNYEVEGDHSYQTDSFIVHNCDTTSMALEQIRPDSFAVGPKIF